jgi:hypothetical protein
LRIAAQRHAVGTGGIGEVAEGGGIEGRSLCIAADGGAVTTGGFGTDTERCRAVPLATLSLPTAVAPLPLALLK